MLLFQEENASDSYPAKHCWILNSAAFISIFDCEWMRLLIYSKPLKWLTIVGPECCKRRFFLWQEWSSEAKTGNGNKLMMTKGKGWNNYWTKVQINWLFLSNLKILKNGPLFDLLTKIFSSPSSSLSSIKNTNLSQPLTISEENYNKLEQIV